MIEQKLVHIHWNPVRTNMVATPAHYLYYSASNYEIGEGLLEVTVTSPLSGVGYIIP